MRLGGRLLIGMVGVSVLAVLGACSTSLDLPDEDVVSIAEPKGAAPPPAAQSAESLALAARYSAIEKDLISRGLLRTDGGGPDTPFDARILSQNFVQVALFDEYSPVAGGLVARETSSRLRRWQEPVRVTIEFGASVPDDQRRRDKATVQALNGQISAASGHPVSLTRDRANFTVLVLDEDERRAIGPRLRALVPGITSDLVRAITALPPSTFCLVIAFSSDDAPYVYRRAISIIRAEHPARLRTSCFHEEITQGMGLANDSPTARPSIFNDDEEFALLTRQDRLMLSILYDRRLTPGMTSAEAMPTIKLIATELLPPQTQDISPDARES